MKKVTITANGSVDLPTPSWATYSVIYMPSDIGTSTAKLSAYDVDLVDGALVAADQVCVEHGRRHNITIDIASYSADFDLYVHWGA